MGIIKLQNAGDAVTWRIKSAEVVAGKFGNQVKFENDSGDILYISEKTAGQQLGRIKLDVENCAGETLTFSRTENRTTPSAAPYWNITVADAVDRAAPTQSKRISYTEAQKGEPDPYRDVPANRVSRQTPERGVSEITQLRARVAREYLDLLGWVKAQDGTLSVDAAQAAAATIWITWGQLGLRTKVDAPEAKPAPAPAPRKPMPEPEIPDARPGDDDLPF